VRLGERTEMVHTAAVTGNLLEVLGVRPLLGRDLRPEEEGLNAPQLAILTHPLWRDRFASDPEVIGRSITVEGSRPPSSASSGPTSAGQGWTRRQWRGTGFPT
jgi:hypothetical protein